MDNKYSKWTDLSEFKSSLNKISKIEEVTGGSLPLAYDDKSIYTYERDGHTLVIGTTGSGKTQTICYPKMYLGEHVGESFIISDVKGDIYDSFAGKYKKDGYKVLALNFANPDYGDMWNPLYLPYTLYKEGNKNDAISLLEELADVLFYEKANVNADPFWSNQCVSLLTGLALYLFENEKEENINISRMITLLDEVDEKILTKIDKESPAYFNLVSIAKAPVETRGSIIAVFNQRMRLFTSRPNLASMLNKSTFDISDISKDKIVVFLIGNNTSSSYLIPVFVRQCCYCLTKSNNKKRFHIMLDDFDDLSKFPSFAQLLSGTRGYYITFTLFCKSLLTLKAYYDDAEFEIIKSLMSCVVYLFANDDYTLKYFSNLCGNVLEHGKEVPLISDTELKVLKPFEAVVIINRMYPIRTKLLPFFSYPVDMSFKEDKLPMNKR